PRRRERSLDECAADSLPLVDREHRDLSEMRRRLRDLRTDRDAATATGGAVECDLGEPRIEAATPCAVREGVEEIGAPVAGSVTPVGPRVHASAIRLIDDLEHRVEIRLVPIADAYPRVVGRRREHLRAPKIDRQIGPQLARKTM